MRLTYQGDRFIFKCDYENREIANRAGFNWCYKTKSWFTTYIKTAARLWQYADDQAKIHLERFVLTCEPWPGGISNPKNPKLKLKPYQKKAIKFVLERNRSYLALDMGLGKTACAVRAFVELSNREPFKLIYLCPPFLAETVKNEIALWSDGTLTTSEFSSLPADPFFDVYILTDSMIHKYIDIFEKVFERLRDNSGLMLAVDEAHRFKTASTRRSKSLYSFLLPHFDKTVFMSGTPMPNRPIELYPVLSNAAPDTIDFMSYHAFGMKYCAGYHAPYGYDFSGRSNMQDLSERIKNKFMLRTKKDEVLKELPPKQESVVVLSTDLPPALSDVDRRLVENLSPDTISSGSLPGMVKTPQGDEIHIATYRREIGEAKVAQALEFIESILEETDESILVFAHHKSVMKALEDGLVDFDPVVVSGDVPPNDRQDLVNRFQDENGPRVFIGQLQAAGTGFTLTKATRVVFVEFSWTPAENDQAADRAHRIGQKSFVLVQYLVYKNSLDRTILETNLHKKDGIKYV